METLLSFPPPTSRASCFWFFQATPKWQQDDTVFRSAAPGGHSAGGSVDQPGGQAEAHWCGIHHCKNCKL